MQYLLTEAAGILDGQYRELLDLIRTDALASPEYRLETPFTSVRHTDIPLLQQELPAVFDRLVYFKATDVERFLSWASTASARSNT